MQSRTLAALILSHEDRDWRLVAAFEHRRGRAPPEVFDRNHRCHAVQVTPRDERLTVLRRSLSRSDADVPAHDHCALIRHAEVLGRVAGMPGKVQEQPLSLLSLGVIIAELSRRLGVLIPELSRRLGALIKVRGIGAPVRCCWCVRHERCRRSLTVRILRPEVRTRRDARARAWPSPVALRPG